MNKTPMKDIKGLEGYYQITNDGKVFSVRRNKFLKPLLDKGGYHFVIMRVNGKEFRQRIHRLVANAYIPNTENLPEVNHKDGVKTNNHWLNLEWSTRAGNVKHAYDTGLKERLRGENHGKSKLVVSVSYGIFYHSVGEAAKSYGIKYDTLKSMLNGANPNKTDLFYA